MEDKEKSTANQESVAGPGEAAKERPNKPAGESETTKKKKLTPMQELARIFKAYNQDVPAGCIAQIISPFEKEEIPSSVPIGHYEVFSSYSREEEEEK
jgi:hypothetical protein